MTARTKAAIAFIALDSVANIGSICFDLQIVRIVTKSLFMPLITAYYILSAGFVYKTVIAACAFSWIGDVFLINTMPAFFHICAIISFLAAHVFFIVIYLRILVYAKSKTKTKTRKVLNKFCAAVSAIIFAALFCVVFFAVNPGDSQTALLVIYGAVLFAHTYAAFILFFFSEFIYKTAGIGKTALVFLGSLFFAASDSMLAYFYVHTTTTFSAVIAVMATYIIAEFLIITGLTGVKKIPA
ncbi:MAG: lysoplasmalogenase [Spirochaetaceae bacterium]|jgi:hypothetical protein|nr:lysoplasmalogenase [Spirochaetaceae bacterium]